jgi:hypothetical protein
MPEYDLENFAYFGLLSNFDPENERDMFLRTSGFLRTAQGYNTAVRTSDLDNIK